LGLQRDCGAAGRQGRRHVRTEGGRFPKNKKYRTMLQYFIIQDQATYKANYGYGLMLSIIVNIGYKPGPSKPSPAPNPSRFSCVLERLAKAPHSHTVTNLALAAIDYS
jgi:hypothetical protein